jgi:hypothetical protein
LSRVSRSVTLSGSVMAPPVPQRSRRTPSPFGCVERPCLS